MAQARLLFAWHLERRLGLAVGGVQFQYVVEHPDIEDRWAVEQMVLALALWRTAHTAAVAVDDVALRDAAETCRKTARAPGLLLAGPVPDVGPYGVPLPAAGDIPAALGVVEQLLEGHASGLVGGGFLGPSPRRLGFVVRELRSVPGWSHGDWTASRDLARRYIDLACQGWRAGEWEVTEHHQAAAWATGMLPGPPGYDYPAVPAPGAGRPSLLQSACRLTALAPRLRTASEVVPRSGRGDLGPVHMVLVAVAGVCGHLSESTQELEWLWAQEIVLPWDRWELLHIPSSLGAQIMETGNLINTLGVFLGSITVSTCF